MRHGNVRALLLVVLVMFLGGVVHAQMLCGDPNQPEYTLPTLSVHTTIRGVHFKFVPVKPNGELFDLCYMATRLEGLTQMNHPLNEDAVDSPVKILDLDTCTCDYVSRTNVLVMDSLESNSPFTLNPSDARRNELLVIIKCSGDFENTRLNLTFSSSPTSYDIVYTHTENTQDLPLIDPPTGQATLIPTQSAQHLKLSMDVVNWPWNTNYTNTYLRLDFAGDCTKLRATSCALTPCGVPEASELCFIHESSYEYCANLIFKVMMDENFRIRAEEGSMANNITLTTPNATLIAYLEKGSIIDDMPYRDDRRVSAITEFQTTSPAINSWPFPVNFKYRNLSNAAPDPGQTLSTGFFSHLNYDPTFVAIFTGVIPQAPSKVDRKATVIAGAAIGTVCAVIIIVLVTAILVTKVPWCRDKVRPFYKRNKKLQPQKVSEIPEEDGKPKKSFWKKSKHPTATPIKPE